MAGSANEATVKREPVESDPPTVRRLQEELDRANNKTQRVIRIAGQYLERKELLQKRIEFLEGLIDQKNIDGPKLRELLQKRIDELTVELAEYKDGQQQACQEGERIHFKICHGGLSRRFTLSRHSDDLFSTLKDKVKQMTDSVDLPLFWMDEDSRNVLESDEDLTAAIEYAQSKNKELPCVHLETGGEKEKEEKPKRKTVTEEESKETFDGVIVWCDNCECVIGSANGGRFKCAVCDNYDLCMDCIGKSSHPNHAFVWLKDAKTEIASSSEVGDAMKKELRNERKRALRDLQNAEEFSDEENGENDDDDDYYPGSSRNFASNKGSSAKRSTNSAGAKEAKRKNTKDDEAGPSKIRIRGSTNCIRDPALSVTPT